MSKIGLVHVKRANIPYMAEAVETILKEAPGAPPPPPRPEPRRVSKLELLDAEISRCAWCGSWATDTHCHFCRTSGYPMITDFERTA